MFFKYTYSVQYGIHIIKVSKIVALDEYILNVSKFAAKFITLLFIVVAKFHCCAVTVSARLPNV